MKKNGQIFALLKPVYWVHDVSETTEETKAVATMSSESVKTNEAQDPQLMQMM
jgi:hypothetical protein